ncbi:DUF4817 domain-containing protein [Trichonephila clavipes]|nr:DUF4817 domain-containing protein [Trichonephila clavipes]
MHFSKNIQGQLAPNESTITLLVQRFRDTGSVAHWKRSGRASAVKPKVENVETALQRGPLKRPSGYINILADSTFLLKMMKGTLGCSKMAQHVVRHMSVWKC